MQFRSPALLSNWCVWRNVCWSTPPPWSVSVVPTVVRAYHSTGHQENLSGWPCSYIWFLFQHFVALTHVATTTEHRNRPQLFKQDSNRCEFEEICVNHPGAEPSLSGLEKICAGNKFLHHFKPRFTIWCWTRKYNSARIGWRQFRCGPYLNDLQTLFQTNNMWLQGSECRFCRTLTNGALSMKIASFLVWRGGHGKETGNFGFLTEGSISLIENTTGGNFHFWGGLRNSEIRLKMKCFQQWNQCGKLVRVRRCWRSSCFFAHHFLEDQILKTNWAHADLVGNPAEISYWPLPVVERYRLVGRYCHSKKTLCTVLRCVINRSEWTRIKWTFSHCLSRRALRVANNAEVEKIHPLRICLANFHWLSGEN